MHDFKNAMHEMFKFNFEKHINKKFISNHIWDNKTIFGTPQITFIPSY
jgi:hypothetical protein